MTSSLPASSASRLSTACCSASLSVRSACTWLVRVSPSDSFSGPAPRTTPIASAMKTDTSETRW